MEEGIVEKLFDFSLYLYDQKNVDAANGLPALMLCPSESQRSVPGDMGWTNYHANAGGWAHLAGWDGVFGAVVTEEGIPALPPLRMAKILDGTSKTAALAEVVNGLTVEGSVPPARPSRLADCFEFGGNPFPSGGGSASLATIRSVFLKRDPLASPVPWSGTGAIEAIPGPKARCGCRGTTTCSPPTPPAGKRGVGGGSFHRPAATTAAWLTWRWSMEVCSPFHRQSIWMCGPTWELARGRQRSSNRGMNSVVHSARRIILA